MTTALVAGGMLAEEVLAGPSDLVLSEVPVQFDVLPPGSALPVPGAAWTAGTTVPLKRVTRHTDGAAAATVALVTASGESFEVTHPDATTNRKEVSLDFGDASRTSARTWARRYLNVAADARRGVTIELIPEVGPRPYRDFGIGDNILVLGEVHRVAAIGFRLDASSITQWSVDLDQPRMLLEERLAAIMRRFLPGGAGGRTILPAPTDPSFPANQTASEQVHTWQYDGSIGSPSTFVLKKNGTAITGGSVTASAGQTKQVTLTDAARKYTRNSDKLTFTADGGVASLEWVPPEGRWIQSFTVRADAGGAGATVTVSIA